jgi:hypothetical protein
MIPFRTIPTIVRSETATEGATRPSLPRVLTPRDNHSSLECASRPHGRSEGILASTRRFGGENHAHFGPGSGPGGVPLGPSRCLYARRVPRGAVFH